MADDRIIRDQLRLMFETSGGDVEHAEEIYHDDAVLEFPQSGERYDGREAFTAWRSQYPAEVAFQVLRVTVRDDVAVVELTANYDGGPQMYGVSVHEFRDGKISHERIYVAEGWDTPDWRKPWLSEQPVDNPGF